MYAEKIKLEVTVRLYNADNYSNGIQFSENVTLEPGGFLEAAGILGKFHELAQSLQKNEVKENVR